MAPPGDDEMKARSAAAKRDGLLIVKHRVKARMAETGISAAKLATRANLTPRSVQRFLASHPKFTLLFQPTYSPWVNQIERLWKTMHDSVTRNHRCATFYQLCQRIAQFLEAAQPFPGNNHALAPLAVERD